MAVTYPYTVPAEQAFMGKERTYSAQTNFRQYAVRLRALKDNPCNPNIAGAIGSDWAVDEPHAIVEKGSNSNGSYVMYAGGKMEWSSSDTISFRSNGVATNIIFNFPVFDAAPERRRFSYYLRNISGNAPTGTIGFFGQFIPSVLTTNRQTMTWSYYAVANPMYDCIAYVIFFGHWY